MGAAFLGWRSLLYVPAHRDRFVAAAHRRGADGVILDLEDGVPAEAKGVARAALAPAAKDLRGEGSDVLVRLNRPWSLAWRDLEAALAAEVRTLVLPKVDGPAAVEIISEYLDEVEAAAGLDPGHTRLVVLLESARGLLRAQEIAAQPRVVALLAGNEDLATELGIAPDPEHMLPLHLRVLLAARAAGILPLGTIGSSADFRDLTGYRERVQRSRDWGFRGTTCIHPDQIDVVHEVYRPSPAQLDEARALVTAFEAGGGEVVAHHGAMVDRPIYLRARRLLAGTNRER